MGNASSRTPAGTREALGTNAKEHKHAIPVHQISNLVKYHDGCTTNMPTIVGSARYVAAVWSSDAIVPLLTVIPCARCFSATWCQGIHTHRKITSGNAEKYRPGPNK